jgi:peptidoglycan hydrolase CwlO-like protein
MPTEVTRSEFDELAQEVQGEKVVTRYILEQTRRNGDDLAALKTRVGRIEVKVDDLDRKVDALDRKVDALDRKVDGMAKSFPDIVRDTMREVLRERDQKR